MEERRIFYSWQSDLPSRTNRGLIEAALRRATKNLNAGGAPEVEPVIDRDTLGEPGAPDIASTIFRKIDEADVFVCDVSIVSKVEGGRPSPNPNVLIELGYALKALGQHQVIPVFNNAYGRIADLPFDLRGKRVIAYAMHAEEEPATARKILELSLGRALEDVFRHLDEQRSIARHIAFATDLVSTLVSIQIFGGEVRELEINPWVDNLGGQFESFAAWLREQSSTVGAIELGFSADMEALARLLDRVVRDQGADVYGSQELEEKTDRAVSAAKALQAEVFKRGPLTYESKKEIRGSLIASNRKLTSWLRRFEAEDDFEYELYKEMLFSISEIGYTLLKISYYPLGWLKEGLSKDLQEIGAPLHLIEQAQELNQYGGEEGLLEELGKIGERLKRLLVGIS